MSVSGVSAEILAGSFVALASAAGTSPLSLTNLPEFLIRFCATFCLLADFLGAAVCSATGSGREDFTSIPAL